MIFKKSGLSYWRFWRILEILGSWTLILRFLASYYCTTTTVLLLLYYYYCTTTAVLEFDSMTSEGMYSIVKGGSWNKVLYYCTVLHYTVKQWLWYLLHYDLLQMAFDLLDAIGGTGEETRRSVIAIALLRSGIALCLSKARAVRHPVADIALQQRVPLVLFHF